MKRGLYEIGDLAKHIQSSVGWDLSFCFGILPDDPGLGIRKIAAFCHYERMNHRQPQIICKDQVIVTKINQYLKHNNRKPPFTPSHKKVASTYDVSGKAVYGDWLSHTCTVETAIAVFKSGKLLSAVKAFNRPAEELVKDSRNAAGDPADYFNYVMLGWSNTTSGYRLAMERLIGHLPNDRELNELFIPGVSFHFLMRRSWHKIIIYLMVITLPKLKITYHWML